MAKEAEALPAAEPTGKSDDVAAVVQDALEKIEEITPLLDVLDAETARAFDLDGARAALDEADASIARAEKLASAIKAYAGCMGRGK